MPQALPNINVAPEAGGPWWWVLRGDAAAKRFDGLRLAAQVFAAVEPIPRRRNRPPRDED